VHDADTNKRVIPENGFLRAQNSLLFNAIVAYRTNQEGQLSSSPSTVALRSALRLRINFESAHPLLKVLQHRLSRFVKTPRRNALIIADTKDRFAKEKIQRAI